MNEQVCILTEDEILSFQQLVKKVMGIDLKGGKRLSCQCRLKHGTVELTQDLS